MRGATTFRYHTEFIKGMEIEKPLPKKLHAIIQLHLLIFFKSKLSGEYQALPELNVICTAERIVPDVTLFRRNSKFLDGDLADPPLLAVEIGSPGQAFSNLLEKCESLAGAGTPMCWIILPETRKAWMFSEFELKEARETLDVELSTTTTSQNGLSVSLGEMWAELDKDA